MATGLAITVEITEQLLTVIHPDCGNNFIFITCALTKLPLRQFQLRSIPKNLCLRLKELKERIFILIEIMLMEIGKNLDGNGMVMARFRYALNAITIT